MKLSVWNKIKIRAVMLWHGLFYGMKAADAEMTEQSNGTGSDGVHENISQGTLWEKLLGGVEDEEVKEVRARHYKVLRAAEGVVTELAPQMNDSGEIEGYTVKNVRKRTMLNKIPDFIEQKDGDDVKLIYDVKMVTPATNSHIDDEQYNLSIIREGTIPRFRMEKYTTRIVIKNHDEKTSKIEFYCKYYADQFSKISALYVNEMNALCTGRKNPQQSDMFDFTGIEFETDASTYSMGYGSGYHFKFTNPHFLEIHPYDGHFIVSFLMDNEIYGEDEFKKYEIDKVEKEYSGQTPYGNTIAPITKDIDYKKMYQEGTEIIENTL